MSIMEMISGPVIGSVIGYGTNYIAVKMLFRPLKPVRIGKFTVPFTPGIIPKRKDKLGRALGEMVGNKLLTKEDIENVLLSNQMKNAVLDEVLKSQIKEEKDSRSIETLLSQNVGEEKYFKNKEKVEDIICHKLVHGVEKVDIGKVIAEEASKAMKQKALGSMLQFMINDDLIASIAGPIGQSVNSYIKNNGMELFKPIVRNEVDGITARSPEDALHEIGIDEEKLRKIMDEVYTSFISKKAESIIELFEITDIVEKKVNDMDVLEIEKLVLSVMKNELDAVVNLGAVIGFILGLFNLLF